MAAVVPPVVAAAVIHAKTPAPTPPEALAKYRAVAKAEAERLRAERGER